MTLRGAPPPGDRPPVSLAEYVHVERKAKALRLSRPQLDKYIRLYDIGAHFRLHRRYTPKTGRP